MFRRYCLILLAAACLLLVSGGLSSLAPARDLSGVKVWMDQGLGLLSRGRFQKAVEVFREMRDACEGEKVCVAFADFYLARCFLETTRYDEALRLLDGSERALKEAGMAMELGVVSYVKARIFAGKGEYKRARDYFRKAEGLLLQAGKAGTRELGLLYGNRAGMEVHLCNYEAARQDLNRARKLLTAAGDARLAELDRFEAQIRARTQDYTGARDLYRKLIGVYKERGSAKGLALVLNDLGHLHEAQSEYRLAEASYTAALDLAREIKDPGTEAMALNNLGNVKWETGDYGGARELFRKALGIRRELGQMHLSANTLNNVGIALLGLGQYEGSLERFREAFTVFHEIGSRNGKATTLHNMALVFKDQGRFLEAKEFSGQAIRLAREIQDRKLLATAILRLGNLYEYYGQFAKALAEYEKAAAIQREIRDRFFLSNTLVAMANLRVRKGEGEQAEQDYRTALEIRREIGAPLVEILCSSALFHIEKQRYAQVGQEQRSKDMELARRLVTEAEEVLKGDHLNDVMLLTYVKARYLAETGDLSSSLAELKHLESKAQSTGSLKFAFLAHVGLGMVHEKRNELPAAQNAFEKAVQYAEAIRETLDLKARATFLNGEEILGVKHIQAYEGLARVIFLQQDHSGSLAMAERTKARAFADNIERSVRELLQRIDPGLHRKLQDLEREMKANREELTKCLATTGDQTRIRQLETARTRLDKEAREIENQTKERYPDYYPIIFPKSVSVGASELRDDEWILSYEVTDSAALVYLNQGGRVVRSWLVPVSASTVNALVHKFRAPLETVQVFDDLKKFMQQGLPAGKKLFDLLVSPILESLPQNVPLVVVPDGKLGILPFEALPMTQGEPGSDRWDGVKFLGSRNLISYYQSITAMNLVRVREKSKARALPGSRFLIVADPTIRCAGGADRVKVSPVAPTELEVVWQHLGSTESTDQSRRKAKMLSHETCTFIDENLTPLQETARLAKDLEIQFSGQVEALLGRSATLMAFEEKIAPKIRNYDRILFATHGIIAGTFSEVQEPAILLSMPQAGADSWLRMSRVLQLEMNPDVVFLLACETGLGEQLAGEGIMGLGRAFQLAGSRSVLMSLWKVEVQASTFLCRMFFQNLKKGYDKKQALDLARIQLRSTKGGIYDHPFFWASFILAGETN